jgi:outer membrane protein insertion porin family
VRWIGLGDRRRLNERDFERDVERIAVLYRASGFLEVVVDTLVRRTDEAAYITFRIEEGPPLVLERLAITGLDTVPLPPARRERLVRDLPLRQGDPFNRLLLGVVADTLATRLRDIGYPRATVYLAERDVDAAARRARLELRVAPGRRAVFGDFTVEGVSGGDSAFVTRLLAARRGRPYRISDVNRSQRNLALSELHRFASVEIDTTRFAPRAPTDWEEGLDSVPLLIRVVPAARHRLSASTGYGTDDCFRAAAGCRRLAADSIGSRELNYAASVSLRRPAFLSPANHLGLVAFAERRSEFTVYRREEYGGSVTLTRETGRRIPVTFGYRLAYGATTASDLTFCAFFNACTPEDIGLLQERQRQGVAIVGVTSLRVNNLLDPSRGSSVGFQVSHSAQYTWSEPFQRFSRAVGDASIYRPVGQDMVAAFRVRAGVLGSPANRIGETTTLFVPPEQRFYAGGPNDVRGFDRNELGPVVYVILDRQLTPGEDDEIPPGLVSVSPVGGNRLLVVNAELRVPSPFLPGRTRLVGFVDGGSVWESSRGDGLAEPFRFRVTPGMGFRVATPLGPARLDMAYNGYRRPPGPLYAAKQDGTLELLRTDYVLPRKSGVTVHFAIGHAF